MRASLNLRQKLHLAARIWGWSLLVRVASLIRPLPWVIRWMSAGKSRAPRQALMPRRLGQVVRRVLTVAGRPPRCLVAAMVAFRLLRVEGHPVELVIGLPEQPQDKEAHAWLELDGIDIGPPPGRGSHVELARYG
jgi:hypothetical protein